MSLFVAFSPAHALVLTGCAGHFFALTVLTSSLHFLHCYPPPLIFCMTRRLEVSNDIGTASTESLFNSTSYHIRLQSVQRLLSHAEARLPPLSITGSAHSTSSPALRLLQSPCGMMLPTLASYTSLGSESCRRSPLDTLRPLAPPPAFATLVSAFGYVQSTSMDLRIPIQRLRTREMTRAWTASWMPVSLSTPVRLPRLLQRERWDAGAMCMAMMSSKSMRRIRMRWMILYWS